MGNNKINLEALNSFIDSATSYVLSEIDTGREFYFDHYWNNVASHTKNFITFFNSEACLQDENKFFELMENVIETVIEQNSDEELVQIFNGYCSADGYSRKSFLIILKFGKVYYCLYRGEYGSEHFLTKDHLSFCEEKILIEKEMYEIEMKNLNENENEEFFENFTVELEFLDGLFL